MKLEIPGQLRGKDAGKIMPVAIRLRKKYEKEVADLKSTGVDVISPILRVGGELGSFGDDAIENLCVENRVAECDVVVAPRRWAEMTEDEIEDLIGPRIRDALSMLLIAAGISSIPKFMENAEQEAEADAGKPGAA
jgi:hypothetical protein